MMAMTVDDVPLYCLLPVHETLHDSTILFDREVAKDFIRKVSGTADGLD
jgi:hypothetical protein